MELFKPIGAGPHGVRQVHAYPAASLLAPVDAVVGPPTGPEMMNKVVALLVICYDEHGGFFDHGRHGAGGRALPQSQRPDITTGTVLRFLASVPTSATADVS